MKKQKQPIVTCHRSHYLIKLDIRKENNLIIICDCDMSQMTVFSNGSNGMYAYFWKYLLQLYFLFFPLSKIFENCLITFQIIFIQ